MSDSNRQVWVIMFKIISRAYITIVSTRNADYGRKQVPGKVVIAMSLQLVTTASQVTDE